MLIFTSYIHFQYYISFCFNQSWCCRDALFYKSSSLDGGKYVCVVHMPRNVKSGLFKVTKNGERQQNYLQKK